MFDTYFDKFITNEEAIVKRLAEYKIFGEAWKQFHKADEVQMCEQFFSHQPEKYAGIGIEFQ